MALSSRFAASSLFAAGLLAACGARTGLLVPESDAGGCAGQNIPIIRPVPNLYFVLDRSGSMKELNKWNTVRTVVSNLMTELGSTARFGATVFADPATNVCGAGVEVLPLQLGDSLGFTATALLQATDIPPAGGTPTAATFRKLLPELTSFTGATFAILATDGGPNCNTNLSCGLATCTANLDNVTAKCLPNTPPNCCAPNGPGYPYDCLDDVATAAAVAQLAAANVLTYVIGIPGSEPYQQTLDDLAKAGGTARASEPFYYQVTTAGADALEAALAQIAAKIEASCTVTLSTTPASPSTLVVSLGGTPVPHDPTNGWELSGTTLTLSGASCAEVQSGRSIGLTVSEGCPITP